jgi:hypothetical protein
MINGDVDIAVSFHENVPTALPQGIVQLQFRNQHTGPFSS